MASRRHFLAAATFGLAALPALPAQSVAGTSLAPHPTAAYPAASRPSVVPATAGPDAAAGGRLPNIVLVLADDLGYGQLGSYGQQLIHTPTLDRLAAEGLRFTQAYSAGPVCAPSRASLLTGLHSGHARVRQNGDPRGVALGDDETTFAEVLRARGYRTACFGKWGFGPQRADQPSHPNWRGFEEFFGYVTHRHAHEYFPAYLWHNGERVALPENADGRKGTYAVDLIEERATAFIAEHADEPFLLLVTPNVPHAPSDIPETGEYADRPWSEANRKHAAQVTRLDTLVGSLVDALGRHGVEQDTLLLVSSDNGPHEEGGVDPDLFEAGGPFRGYKRNLYEGGVRVPLIAWWPGTVRPAVTDRVTPLVDVLPTVAELAGAPAPRDIDGLSAAALLSPRPGAAPEHGHLYWQRLDGHTTSRANAVDQGRLGRLAEAVRREDWKAVRFAPARDRSAPDESWEFELYDLATDPGETTDVHAEHPEVVAELTALLRASWVETHEREGFGVRVAAPDLARPGEPFTVTATFTNASARTWAEPRLGLTAPEGWRVRLAGPDRRRRLAPGAALVTRWQVTPPADAAEATTTAVLRARGSARHQGGLVRYEARAALATATTPAETGVEAGVEPGVEAAVA
ncbi:sulfatase-like hydrolase/transferase [Streptomyces sp. 4N509B]|uniref:sulfatase-like hydrolase/transferase n=1 Tax=Streptomyces sp. 4N509B TaxID=3457413 RepID=UPI003FD4E18B